MHAAVEVTREEFRTFYEENFHTVWRHLRRFRVHEDDVADLAHEVLVFAYRHFDAVPAYPSGWLARVSFELVRNYRRKAYRRREQLAPHVIEAALCEQAEDDTTEVVLEALDRMPEAQRTLLLRYHLADETLHAIAKDLRVARSTVQLRIAAAETTFEGWIRRLFGEDVGTASRASLFVPFTFAGLLPRLSESPEIAAHVRLDGWARLARAIDAAKVSAGVPAHAAPRVVKVGLPVSGAPAKLAIAFAVGGPAAFVGMLLGHLLGQGVAAAEGARTVSPSLREATTPISVLEESIRKGAWAPVPALQTDSTTNGRHVDLELALLDYGKNQLKQGNYKQVFRMIREHAIRFPKSTHFDDCAILMAHAKMAQALLDAEKAAKKAADADKPKP